MIVFNIFMEQIEVSIYEKLKEAIDKKDKLQLKEIFDVNPTIDIAEAFENEEDVKNLIYVLRVVPKDYGAEFFTELNNDQKEKIINAFTDKELIELLDYSFADDIVDTAEELPANVVSRILKVAPASLRKSINQLLNYKENTAGSLMTVEYIEMKDSYSVEATIDELRKKGKDAETIYTIFVRDNKRTLVGTVNLDDLIFAQKEELLRDIMNKDFVTCNVNDDQEAVANDFKRYDLNVMAVVNDENKIIGIITVDDVMDILVEEANEDIAKLNNISDMSEPYLKTPVFRLVVKCFPWIIALMVLQVFSTFIMSSFESALSSFIVLTFFTSVICDAGGNSGGQTTTLIVRSLALDEFKKGDAKRVLWKEVRVSLLIATIISIFAFGWLMFEMSVLKIGDSAFNDPTSLVYIKAAELGKPIVMMTISALVASTLFITIVFSRLVGCLIPFFAKLIKKDPAVICGPLTTTLVDVTCLLVYFLLWTCVFSKILGL